MCGRYAFFMPPAMLKERLGLENLLNIPPRYNCAPMQAQTITIKGRAGQARWGFCPEWSKEDNASSAARMINARSETVAEKAAYRESWHKGRRCLVPANGFFEWAEQDGEKRPYYITHTSSELLLFAGLWSKVGDLVTFTILTKNADENLQHLHHRSPVMINEDAASEWFSGGHESAGALIAASRTQSLQFHAVSKDVGSVANDHEGLLEPYERAQKQLLL